MKNNRFFVSKKIIEYNTGKEDVVRKIQALIDGDVKSYELSIGVYSRYDGYVNDDGFVLYPKSNRSIYDYTVIQGKFITDEKKVDLEFYCKDDIIVLESDRIDHPESRRIDQFQSFRNRQCSGRLLSLRF